MSSSRILVLYYSRTGTTRAVAQALRSELRCDIERIHDSTPRSGVGGFVRSALDSVLGRPAALLPIKSNLRDYDLVIIGGPVWSGHIATPIRTLLNQHRGELGRVAFFCTYLGTGSAYALKEMKAFAGKEPAITLDVRSADARSSAIRPKLRAFAAALGAVRRPQRKSSTASQSPRDGRRDEAA